MGENVSSTEASLKVEQNTEQQAVIIDAYTRIVETYLHIWYDGQMPADKEVFIGRLLLVSVAEPSTPEATGALIEKFLREAVESVAKYRASRWRN